MNEEKEPTSTPTTITLRPEEYRSLKEKAEAWDEIKADLIVAEQNLAAWFSPLREARGDPVQRAIACMLNVVSRITTPRPHPLRRHEDG